MKLFINSVLCLLTVVQSVKSACHTPHDKKLRKCHKSRTLDGEGLERLALLSDRDYFRDTLLKPFLTVRVSDTDAIRIVQQHVRWHMSAQGWHVWDDMFTASTPLGLKRFTNVVATQNPEATRTLTFACHVDSKYYPAVKFIGATDAAVPCAMLLDLARVLNSSLLARSDHKLNEVSLRFIFFDGKEAFVQWTKKGTLYGARHLANAMAYAIDDMDVMVLLNVIGTEDTRFISWFADTDHLFERLQETEMRLAERGLLLPKADFQNRTESRYFRQDITFLRVYTSIQDDHVPFVKKGARVLHLITYPLPPVWHEVDDDEAHLHYPTIDNIRRILRVFAAEYLHLSP